MGRIFTPTPNDFGTTDAVVIGGGIVGVSTAFWLSKAGLDVVIVEMRDGLSTLTTPASAECFRAQFAEPAMAALAIPSLEMFEHFDQVIGLPGYSISIKQQGYLFLTDDPETVGDLKENVEQQHKLGVTDSEFIKRAEILARFPYISPSVLAATFRQRDGWLSCHELTQGFAKGCDARFFINTKATGIQMDKKGICGVETNRGILQSRIVVNAAGPFAAEIGKMVKLDLPLEPVRRQKVYITTSVEIPQNAPFTVDVNNNSYWRPEPGGVIIGWVDSDEPVSRPSEKVHTDWEFPAIALDKVKRLTPFFEDVEKAVRQPDMNTSAGFYMYTPDDQPLIGPVPEVPGFYVNCGYWAGVMLSPQAGKRISELITGKMDPGDNPLRPTRFEEGLGKKGKTLMSH
ncbi:MAG: FAD-binding oxidoreductase [Deltaproteobacteria bacterium]|jgi:sarcosine oxidase subunit beta|nr:FAD-binding oxidoreductase [Deltaproteobacteria bacterium]